MHKVVTGTMEQGVRTHAGKNRPQEEKYRVNHGQKYMYEQGRNIIVELYSISALGSTFGGKEKNRATALE